MLLLYMSSSECFNLSLYLDLFMTCFYSLEQVEALDFKYDEYCWAITSKAQCGDLTHGAKKSPFWRHFNVNWSICQDKLGTNIGKSCKSRRVLCRRSALLLGR